eukprot:SM000241S08520  [mRNA]  locus=s241:182591:184642:- [translate_table: standard]
MPVVQAGASMECMVGLSNTGSSKLTVVGIRSTLHMPGDYRMLVQNLTATEIANATVVPGVQASFAYNFRLHPALQILDKAVMALTPTPCAGATALPCLAFAQPREFTLATAIFYLVDGQLHASAAFNSTVDVTEASGPLSGETIFLTLLAAGVLGLLGMWAYAQLQKLSKVRLPTIVIAGAVSATPTAAVGHGKSAIAEFSKSRRVKPGVETGTRTIDVQSNEWLQGTALTAKQPKYVAQPKRSFRSKSVK